MGCASAAASRRRVGDRLALCVLCRGSTAQGAADSIMSNCRSIVEAHHRSYFAEQGSPEEDTVPNPWLYLKLIPATDNVRPNSSRPAPALCPGSLFVPASVCLRWLLVAALSRRWRDWWWFARRVQVVKTTHLLSSSGASNPYLSALAKYAPLPLPLLPPLSPQRLMHLTFLCCAGVMRCVRTLWRCTAAARQARPAMPTSRLTQRRSQPRRRH